jgi:hypothetical protein
MTVFANAAISIEVGSPEQSRCAAGRPLTSAASLRAIAVGSLAYPPMAQPMPSMRRRRVSWRALGVSASNERLAT